MDVKIIYEDSEVLVIDKPAGLTVNKAESTRGQETVQEWAEAHFEIANGEYREENEKEFAKKHGIVHRLDKDTSGVLIIAKMLESYLRLKSQFQNRETKKTYLALVHGLVEPEQGEINAPIDRNPFNRTHFGVFPGGREAATSYKVYKNYNVYSLLEVFPKTGRTHQIIVHLKHIGHPIVSDPLYVGRKQLREDLKWCPRLFLHASRLEIDGKLFEAPLPKDLEQVLKVV